MAGVLEYSHLLLIMARLHIILDHLLQVPHHHKPKRNLVRWPMKTEFFTNLYGRHDWRLKRSPKTRGLV
ncbi:hypothetical protein NQ317_003273 [Molorchus minor]|uniref:Uncharacterized protein n=1 Tax=Molorchus minor TaxID=1323400 RepID=A0ABQ9JNB4_9CUCU|nr:hypothetical protein NQ317_003273 [Molorchus minor]